MTQLTVILPVYNGMPHLPKAVRSILDQTLTDLRLLVINDGSTDGTLAYLQSIDDPRVEVLGGKHQGLGDALNLGLEHCDTEFVARMDADDISVPDRLERQLEFLDQHPEVGVLGTQFRYFGGEDRFVFSPRIPCDHDAIHADLKLGRLSLVHASLVFRTEVLRQVGGYRVRGMGEDWDLFLRLGNVTRFANLPDELYLWRLHEGNTGVRRYRGSQMGTPFALECARRRDAGEKEITFDEFVELEKKRPLWSRIVINLDYLSLALYRGGLSDIANGRTIRGWARLASASLCAPGRALRRIQRLLPGHQRSKNSESAE
jgi:glycosyltransferase involved in cell wall biosynthesis